MTTINPIFTGVAAHIGKYADAVAVWKEGRAAVTVAALRIISSLAPNVRPMTTEHGTARGLLRRSW